MKKFLKRHKKVVIQVAFIGLALVLVPLPAYAGIDESGMAIYKKLAKIGKWAIIIKGAIDVIQSAINGDFQQAKTQFMGYLLAFAILLAIPKGLDEVEDAFGY